MDEIKLSIPASTETQEIVESIDDLRSRLIVEVDKITTLVREELASVDAETNSNLELIYKEVSVALDLLSNNIQNLETGMVTDELILQRLEDREAVLFSDLIEGFNLPSDFNLMDFCIRNSDVHQVIFSSTKVVENTTRLYRFPYFYDLTCCEKKIRTNSKTSRSIIKLLVQGEIAASESEISLRQLAYRLFNVPVVPGSRYFEEGISNYPELNSFFTLDINSPRGLLRVIPQKALLDMMKVPKSKR